jgi:hypothetical protein
VIQARVPVLTTYLVYRERGDDTVLDEDESINFQVHLNELEVILYFDEKHIRFH